MSDTPVAAAGATPVSTPAATSDANPAQATNTSPIAGQGTATVVADAQATLNDPNASKAEKVEAKKTLKQLTLKVDGKEVVQDLPFDLPDDPKIVEWMQRELQMSKMSGKRAEYAKGLEKDIQQFLTDLKADPIATLSDPNISIDLKKLAEKVMLTEIEESKKSPEQKQLEKERKELKAERDSIEKDKKDRESQENQRLQEKYEQEYDSQISAALDSNKIPRSEAAVKKILAYAELAVAANKDVSINDIIPLVKDELAQDAKMHIEALGDDQIEEFMGKAFMDRVRKINVAKIKKANANPAVNAPAKVADSGKKTTEDKRTEKKVTMKQFFGRGV